MDWTVVVRHKRAPGGSSRRCATLSSNSLSVGKAPLNLSEKLVDSVASLRFEQQKEEVEVEAEQLRRMSRAVAKVEQSEFFARFMRQMRDLGVVEKLNGSGDRETAGKDASIELVVYGVGSITHSEVSRCQLALALLLKWSVAAIGEVLVYDPVMTSAERRVMARLGCRALADDDERPPPLGRPTLFYMPHCDVELYESVLLASVAGGVLGRLAILGNSFRTYQERWSVSPLPQGERPTCLLRVQKSVDETPVADDFFPNAFNDTSWHFFPEIQG